MAKPAEITDANFQEEVLNSDVPVLVDFWAEWCAPCRLIGPTIEELAGEYEGRVKIGKMDVDSNPGTPAKFNIRGIPALLVFKDGEVVDSIIGAQPKPAIESRLQNVL